MGWKNINAIIEGSLYLGNTQAARSSRCLTERRITHILSVCADEIPAEMTESGITHMRIPVEDIDYADICIHLPSACRFIGRALSDNGVVLVHCTQGLSRSATVITAYLMCTQQISAANAMNIVRTARDQVWINPGFYEQLIVFELCRYIPSPANGIYANWRSKIDRQLKAAGIPS